MSSPYTIANYNIPDMFFNNNKYCEQTTPGVYAAKEQTGSALTNTPAAATADTECKKNYSLSKDMQALQNQHSASHEKIDNIQLLYSRELIYTINLTAGIGGLILYLYYNK